MPRANAAHRQCRTRGAAAVNGAESAHKGEPAFRDCIKNLARQGRVGFHSYAGIFLRSLRPRRPFSGRREKLPLQSDVLGLAGVMRDGARKLRQSAEPPSFLASAAAGRSSRGCSEKCPRPGAKAPPPLPPAAARIRAGAVAPEPAFAACIRPEIADRPHPAAKRH